MGEDGGQLGKQQLQGNQKERRKSTKTKGGEVEEMANFGIFLQLSILCFFTVSNGLPYGGGFGNTNANAIANGGGFGNTNANAIANRGYKGYNRATNANAIANGGGGGNTNANAIANRGYPAPPPPPSYGYKR